MTPLEAIEAHLEQDLEQRKRYGPNENCRRCGGFRRLGRLTPEYVEIDCPDCNGTGKSPAITQAESMLKLCRDERKRVERLVGRMEYVKMHSGHHWVINALAEYNAPVEEQNHE